MVERLGRLVTAEAEDEPARERLPAARAQLAAQQEGAPGRERRRSQRQHVVAHDRPGRRGQRPGQQGRARNGARPGQVPAVRRIHEVDQQRVKAVLDRMRPPGERPDEARLIRAVGADDAASALAQDAAAEEYEREQRIAREGGEWAPTRPSGRCASRDRRPPSPAGIPRRRRRPTRPARRSSATSPCSVPSGRSCAWRRRS